MEKNKVIIKKLFWNKWKNSKEQNKKKLQRKLS